MHILLIHQAFVTISEPGGTRHHELARALVQKGHTITIIASAVSYLTGQAGKVKISWKTIDNLEQGITLIRVYTYPALHKSFVHRVISFFSFMLTSFLAGLAVKGVDLIWGTSPPIFQGFTAWLAARLKRAVFVFEVRDLWPAFAIAVGVLKNPVLIRLSLWLESFLYSQANTVIVNSPGFIEHVRLKGANQIELIPNAADPDMFMNRGLKPAFDWGVNLEGKFICLYAGAHGLSNDLEVILESAKILKNDRDIVFILVGDGKEKPKLRQKAREFDLNNVIFLTPVPKDQMIGVIAGSDACIAILKPIELYKTTYPNKVFDYMAAEKPVILAIDGVIRDVVEKANAGIFVPPGDPDKMSEAILYLKNHPQETVKMGMNGREYVIENFNRAFISDQLEEVFCDAMLASRKKVEG